MLALVRNLMEPQRKVAGSGWGGLPQRTQRARRLIGRGECGSIGGIFSNCLGLLKRDFQEIPQQHGRPYKRNRQDAKDAKKEEMRYGTGQRG